MWKIILVIIALILINLISEDWPQDETFLSFLIIVALIVLGVVYKVKKNSSTNAIAVNNAAVDAKNDGYDYNFQAQGTSIAISKTDRTLRLEEKGKVKIYPFSMIRSWETNLQSGGNAIGSGIAVAANNLAALRANRLSSGLFIYTKDIDNVTWRIEMLAKADQAKWMEILQQNINESSSAD